MVVYMFYGRRLEEYKRQKSNHTHYVGTAWLVSSKGKSRGTVYLQNST